MPEQKIPGQRRDHLAIARGFLDRISQLKAILQKKGISKNHRDFRRIKIWQAHAEKHMAMHKDVSEAAFGFTKNMVNPYLRNEQEEKPQKNFKDFVNDSGKEVQQLSGKKEKITINPQLKTIQTNLPGGQQK